MNKQVCLLMGMVLLNVSTGYAQKYGALDTALAIEDLSDTTDNLSFDNTSQLIISAGIGNIPYALQSKTGVTTQGLYVKPGIAYFHKSGLNISACAYNLLVPQANGWFEYDITPGYDFDKGDAVSFGFSYTLYLFNHSFPLEQSPLTNEFYGYITENNWWVKPTIGLDYAVGQFKDSISNLLHDAGDVALLAEISHRFTATDLLSTRDEFDFTPGITLFTGTDKYLRGFGSARYIRHDKTTKRVIKRRPKKGSRYAPVKLYTNSYTPMQAKFLPRVVETALDISYNIGKFTLEPQCYLDVPLQSGEGNANFYFLTTVSVTF